MPGGPSLLFLAFLLGFLPWGALHSRRKMRPTLERTGPGSRSERLVIWANTLFAQGLLLLLAGLAGRSFGFRFFAPVAPRAAAAAAVALAICFGLRALARAWRTEEERRKLVVSRLAPRSALEWGVFVLMALLAAVAEEIAYRGVGVAVLTFWSGQAMVAVLVCSAAFAVAHALQGWKSVVIILGFAFLMHALVAVTGSLVPAMVVHFVYDLAAGIAIARQAVSLDRAAAVA
ncbi:MAG TPA: CPBP family intramembrane glutamic endopeptidase [Candidatus Polarisedimenticolia bacterium]|jgi:membrane protease YdiL (CAAX protease family)|nr:CPBP family intramembrane glutamic endopeptidase [Candidatus Polarisedimenticolia bacterium]